MLDLSNISLVTIGSTKILETLKAVEICQSIAKFKEHIFFTNETSVHNRVNIDRMDSIKDYDRFVVKSMPSLLDTDYALTVHWDGFIVNTEAWTDEFLQYDYIGAPWPWFNFICGNGGFCLKSRKFLEVQQQLVKDIEVTDPDDVTLCIVLRKKFIENGCKYAPPHISYRFSTEYGGYKNFKSFGFHDFRVNPQFSELIEL